MQPDQPFGMSLRVQWGISLTVVGILLIVLTPVWGRVPLLDGTHVWKAWWWDAFLLGWPTAIIGILLWWPARSR